MSVIRSTFLLALTVSAAFSGVEQASVVTTGQLTDNYVGADGRRVSGIDSYGGEDYNNHWMDITRTIERDVNGFVSSSFLEVKVNSGFVKKNDINGNSGIKFGDLFLMDADNYEVADTCADGINVGCNEYTEQTTNARYIYTEQSTNQWEYAFDLGGMRKDSYADDVIIDGNLRDLSDINESISDPQEAYEQSVYSTNDNREWQAIMSNDSYVNNTVGEGSWKTLIGQDLLVMSFDITGTSLATTDQIALRWAMTCANDIIEVIANLTDNPPTQIPEPTTLLMLLTALAVTMRQRNKFKV